MSFQDLNPTPSQVGENVVGGAITEVQGAAGGDVTFTNPNADVFIATGITGGSGNITVALPTPTSIRGARLILDGLATTGVVSLVITGLAGTNPMAGVDSSVGELGLYWNGTDWYVTAYVGN